MLLSEICPQWQKCHLHNSARYLDISATMGFGKQRFIDTIVCNCYNRLPCKHNEKLLVSLLCSVGCSPCLKHHNCFLRTSLKGFNGSNIHLGSFEIGSKCRSELPDNDLSDRGSVKIPMLISPTTTLGNTDDKDKDHLTQRNHCNSPIRSLKLL